MKNRIKEVRKEKGITQKDLAERLGITRQAVSSIENSKSVKWGTLKKVADALDCAVGDLVEYRVFENTEAFRKAWKAAADRIERPEGVTDQEYNKVVLEFTIQDIRTIDDRKFIEALSAPALKLNASGRNLLLNDAERYAEIEALTK